MTTFPRLVSAEPFVQTHLDIGYASAQLETARKRIATGCKISFRDGEFRVHDEWGRITMLTADPSKAINRYFFQCSLAKQQAELAADTYRDNVLGLTHPMGKW